MSTPTGNKWPVTSLVENPTPLGGGFLPVGEPFQVEGQKQLLFWGDIDFQASTAVAVCVFGRKTKDALKDYELPNIGRAYDINEVRPAIYHIIGPYSKFLLPIALGDMIPWFLVKMRAIGGSPGDFAILNLLEFSMRG